MRAKSMILAAVLMLAAVAHADVFNLGGVRDPLTGAWTGVASLETVTVGDAGNAADMRYNTDYDPDYYVYGRPEGYGAVAYTYKIGKFEVTAGQYTAFLNAVAATDTYSLYSKNMWLNVDGCKIHRSGLSGSYAYTVPSEYANLPVNIVSWGDAVRFANWLTNGQPTGPQNLSTTEDGSYYLNGAMTNAQLTAVTRKANAKYVIPTEDEWYKAAYYKGGSNNADYWTYPTRSNTAPGPDMTDASGNNANRNGSGPTVVGEFQNSVSPYGTFDQAGNILEWNEAILSDLNGVGTYRGFRGGSYSAGSPSAAERGYYDYPSEENRVPVGFRIVAVPEPATLSLLALGGLAVLRKRRK